MPLTETRDVELRTTIAAAAAPGVAIVVFGGIYGSIAQPLMGASATIATSLLIFSGAVQFAIIALLSAGAGAGAVIAGAATLNLRNLVLGAVVRGRIGGGRLRRAAVAWFMVDESAGLALAAGPHAAGALVSSGIIFYVCWQLGTLLGLLGASVDSIRMAAGAVFPVLFIALAALSCSSRSVAVRGAVAAGATAAVSLLWPQARGLAAVAVAIAVAVPGREP